MPPSGAGAEAVTCKHCGKLYKNQRSLREHLRHHCKRCKSASPRKYTPARCKHCGKVFHSANSLRVHVSTQHAREYARSPKSVKGHRAPLKKTRHRRSERGSAHSATKEGSKPASPKPSTALTEKPVQHSALPPGGERQRSSWEAALRRELRAASAKAGQETS